MKHGSWIDKALVLTPHNGATGSAELHYSWADGAAQRALMTWLCQYWIHYHSNSLREYYEDRLRDCTYKSLLDSYKDSAPRLASIFAICYYCATSLFWLFRKNTLINKQMNNQTFGGRWFLWTTGLFSHQEYFHNYVTMIFNIHTHKVTLGIEVNSYLPWCNFKALSKCLWRCDVAYCTV